jgi:hypothetical protein
LIVCNPFSSALADRGGNYHMTAAGYSLILLSMSHHASSRRLPVNAIPPSNAYPDIKVVKHVAQKIERSRAPVCQ